MKHDWTCGRYVLRWNEGRTAVRVFDRVRRKYIDKEGPTPHVRARKKASCASS